MIIIYCIYIQYIYRQMLYSFLLFSLHWSLYMVVHREACRSHDPDEHTMSQLTLKKTHSWRTSGRPLCWRGRLWPLVQSVHHPLRHPVRHRLRHPTQMTVVTQQLWSLKKKCQAGGWKIWRQSSSGGIHNSGTGLPRTFVRQFSRKETFTNLVDQDFVKSDPSPSKNS